VALQQVAPKPSIPRPAPPPWSVPTRSAVEAVNELLALPWGGGLSEQYTEDAKESILKALEGHVLVDQEDKIRDPVTNNTIGDWSFKLTVEDVSASIDMAAPPGFRDVSLSGFTIEVPHGGRWNFAIRGSLQARAKVKIGAEASWSPKIGFGLRVMDFQVTAGATLNAAEPNRPRLVNSSVKPELKVGGSGFIPISIPINPDVQLSEDGSLKLTYPITNLSLGLDPLSAHLDGELVIALIPQAFNFNGLDDVVNAISVQRLELALQGMLKFKLENVTEQEASFKLATNFLIPTLPEVNDLFRPLGSGVPRIWAENHPLGKTPAPSGTFNFGASAEEIEFLIVANNPSSGFFSHLPWGVVFSLDSRPVDSTPFDPRRVVGIPLNKYSYGVEGDAAIWTGHYLAAEAFRYAATKDSADLKRVREVVAGIKRLFDVTQGAAVIDGHRYPVQTRGLLSRFARPSTSPIDFTDVPEESLKAGARGCYYENPEGGWRLQWVGGFSNFATYAEVERQLNRLPSILRSNAKVIPIGTVWYGWGCGGISPLARENIRLGKPISRDQYSGIFLGLAYAFELVPEVRADIGPLIEQALDFLIDNFWNVPLPPQNRIATSFIGNFDKQLAFLLIGKRVNPIKYSLIYDHYAPASGVAWLPIWFSTLDPIFQYYKFNLLHANLGPTLLLEKNPEWRENYMIGYRMLRRATAHHKNAYFNLVRILVEPPSQRTATAASPSGTNMSISLADEIKSILEEWLERRKRVVVVSGLPRNILADFNFQKGLRPNNVALYHPLLGDTRKPFDLATYTLPIWGRIGYGMDFVWQRHPFSVIPADCPNIPLDLPDPSIIDSKRIIECGSDWRRREAPGVDYLLTYWMGAYLDVLPKP